jgi:hypothetical protein
VKDPTYVTGPKTLNWHIALCLFGSNLRFENNRFLKYDCILKTFIGADNNSLLVQFSVSKQQSRFRPGVAQRVQEVTVPRLHDNGTGWW